MDFRVDTSQINAWGARLGAEAEPVVQSEMTNAMQRSVLIAQGGIMRDTPFKSGNLRRRWTSEVRLAGGTITGVVGNNTPYGPIVVSGRGPIVAKGRALRFVIGGKVLFRKRVGPAKANPFVERAFNAAKPAILREFDQVIPRIKARLGFS